MSRAGSAGARPGRSSSALLVIAVVLLGGVGGGAADRADDPLGTARAGLAVGTSSPTDVPRASPTSPTSPPSAPADAGGTLGPAPTVAPLGAPGPVTGAAGGSAPGLAPSAREISGPEPFVPTGLELPSGRRAPVVPADTAADGVLTVPADPATVGWWTGGAQVGDPYGSTVLAGHVDSEEYGIGILAELGRVRAGDRVRVTAGTAYRTFRVRSVEQIPKARLAADTAVFDQGGPARLVLITCGGRYDAVARAYDDNLVVVADPVD